MESCYEKIFRIRKVPLIFGKFENKISHKKTLKKIIRILRNQRIRVIREEWVTKLLSDPYFFYQFGKNFSTVLLCKINVLGIFNIVDFFQIFVLL